MILQQKRSKDESTTVLQRVTCVVKGRALRIPKGPGRLSAHLPQVLTTRAELLLTRAAGHRRRLTALQHLTTPAPPRHPSTLQAKHLFFWCFFLRKEKINQNRIPQPRTYHFLANHKFWQNVFYVIVIQFLFLQMDTFYLASCVYVCVCVKGRKRWSSKTINTNLNNIRIATIVTKLKCDTILKNTYDKNVILGTSLVVQWLGLQASTAGGPSSIPGRGTKIPHATGGKKKKTFSNIRALSEKQILF